MTYLSLKDFRASVATMSHAEFQGKMFIGAPEHDDLVAHHVYDNAYWIAQTKSAFVLHLDGDEQNIDNLMTLERKLWYFARDDNGYGDEAEVRIAAAFADRVREYAGLHMGEINERNSRLEYNGCCATYDYMDPSVFMLEAFEEVMGTEFSPASQEDIDIVNAAWETARADGFQSGATEIMSESEGEAAPAATVETIYTLVLTPQQHATILAALRFWQVHAFSGEAFDGPHEDIASNGGAFAPLTAAEIDDLVEEIN